MPEAGLTLSPACSLRVLRPLLFAATLTLAGLVRRVYRPWAYQEGVSHFRVADWAPSLLFIFGLGMLVATVAGRVARLRQVKYWAMIGVGAGALAYEVSQAFRPDRSFDWTDAVATVLGMFGAMLVERAATEAERKLSRS